jgi:hypothetical protein
MINSCAAVLFSFLIVYWKLYLADILKWSAIQSYLFSEIHWWASALDENPLIKGSIRSISE